MEYEDGAMKVYHKSTSYVRIENALSEQPPFDGFEAGLLDFDAHIDWISVSFRCNDGVWVVMDPFLTTWLQVLRPRATDGRALRILEEIETKKPGSAFPFQRYTWSGLMNRTLVECTCHHCGKMGEKPTRLKKCGKCKLVHYCNRECQRAAFKEHKIVCSPSSSLLRVWRHGDPNVAEKDMMVKCVREIDAVPAGHWVGVRMRDNEDGLGLQ